MIVTEEFIKSMSSEPSGQKKTMPTIFDELRWATEHSQQPLEQVIQMISEFHGAWTGMNAITLQILSDLTSLYSNPNNKVILAQARQAHKSLASVNTPSTVGRINNITANDMQVPLLRQFITTCQSIHPSINTYIQNNIGKYPYFQQISEQVGGLGQIILTSKDVHPLKRVETGGNISMTSDYPIRRSVDRKIFTNISKLIDESDSLVNCLFLRAMRPGGNNAILSPGDNSSMSHGYNYTMDVANADRNKQAIAPCLTKAVLKFGPAIELCDAYFPIDYQVKLEPQYFTLKTETGEYTADALNRPITRTIPTPVAKDEDAMQIA